MTLAWSKSDEELIDEYYGTKEPDVIQ